jgi:hypothetical protein
VQVVGQVAAPLQTSGEQEGEPEDPSGRMVHVPSAVAPSAAEQTSQAPPHALLQHTPFVQ